MSKVVTFKRDGEYVLSRAQANRKEGRLLEAVKLARSAVELEPDNIEGWMTLAQTLCEMGLYEQSNRVLSQMFSVPGAPAECLLGMAYNFLGMDDMDAAFGATMAMLANDNGATERADVLAILINIMETNMMDSFELRHDRHINWLCRRALEHIDNGNAQAALPLAEKAFGLDADSCDAVRVFAMALMRTGDAKRAAVVIEPTVWRKDCDHRNVLEAVRIFNSLGDEKKAASIARVLLSKKPQAEELKSALGAACEIKDDAMVSQLAWRALEKEPFDTRILHICAVNRVREKRPVEQAESFWTRAVSIDPEDVVARYYLKLVEEGNISSDMSYAYELPQSETEKFHGMLVRAQMLDDKQLDAVISESPDMREACLWAMCSQANGSDMALARELLFRSDTAWARQLYSRSMNRQYRISCRSLKAMGSSTLIAIGLSGELVPPFLERSIELTLGLIGGAIEDERLSVFNKTLKPLLNAKNLPVHSDARSWATVLAYNVMKDMDMSVELSTVAMKMGSSLGRVKRCQRFYAAQKEKQ